jgi:uncharacterized protein (DUF885 family)
MRRTPFAPLLLASAITVLAMATPPMQALAAPAGVSPAQTPAARLRALFVASDEASLQRNPLQALFRGDLRYADRFGDNITDAYLAGEQAAAKADLAVLAKIDRAALGPEDRLSYDVFKYQTESGLKGFEPALLRAQIERPIDHFNGFQTFVPDLSSGEGAAPFKTIADYDNNLKRLDGYVLYLDRAIGRMRDGLKHGITNPRLVMANVVGQLDALLLARVEDSVFYKPVTKFPDDLADADKARLTTAYAAFIKDKLNPA